MSSRLTSLLLLAAATACASPAPSAAPSEDVRASVDAANARFMQFVRAGQVDSVASLYTEDASLLHSNHTAVHGRAGIAQVMTGLLASDVEIALVTTRLVAADSLASEEGTYTLTMRPKGDSTAQAITDKGAYTVTWIKRNGTWQMLLDAVVSDAPLPAQGAPAS